MCIRRLFFAVVAATLLPTVVAAQSASFNPKTHTTVTAGQTIQVTNNVNDLGVIQLKKEDGTVIETLQLAAGPGKTQAFPVPNDTSLIGTTLTVEVSYLGGSPGASAQYPVN